MPLLYRRRIEVEVAGLQIKDLRMRFSVERQMDPTQDAGTLEIFNLNEQNSDRIYQRGGLVRIKAGYPETVAVIFEGTSQRVIRAREGLAHITRITLGDNVRSSRRLAGTFNKIYEGQVSTRRIAVDIIREGLKLEPGPLDAIPEAATFNNFYWPGSPATAALTALLRPIGCHWFEQDGLVRVNRAGRTQADAPMIRKDKTNGLIETIVGTDEGAEARLFLDGRIVLGSRLDLDDGRMTGRFKVVGVRHVGDNWAASEFVTECDLRPVAA